MRPPAGGSLFPEPPGERPWHVVCWRFPGILRTIMVSQRHPQLFRVLLLAALTAAGCSSYQSFDSAGYLRQQYAREVGAQEAQRVEVPFELDGEIRAALGKLPPLASELRRINQVNDFIFDGLRLQYTLTPTRNAVDTYRTREGNCLSFVNLFVGVARDRGLNPSYVEVTDLQKWNHRDGMRSEEHTSELQSRQY